MADKQDLRIERRYLWISVGASLVIGAVAVVFSAVSNSEAILLDGLFNVVYFIAGILTLKVAQLVQRGDDERFPFGYGFFEPLINGLKGTLVLGLTMLALFGAIEALFSGGRPIAASTAVIYGAFAATVCWVVAMVTRRGANKTKSPLIMVDAENWVLNAAISSAVALAFVGNLLIEGSSLAPISPFVDPILVLVVIAISISVPIRMAWQAVMELLNRAPTPDIIASVRNSVEQGVSDLPVRKMFLRVVQPGRTRLVMAHVVLPAEYRIDSLASLDAVRVKTLENLKESHRDTAVDLIFTADPNWGAPVGDASPA